MRVEILKTIMGLADPAHGLRDYCFREGEVVELHDDLAVKWFNSRIAKPAGEIPELAVVGAGETAVRKRGKKRA